MLQVAQLPGLPVMQGGQIVGIVTEESLLAHFASDRADGLHISDVMEPNPPCASAYMTVGQAAELIDSTHTEMLPVVDEFGGFRGVVTRSDILASHLNLMRPPVIAGMATPLGVHLTTGAVCGGAGSLGLYLTGVAMSLMLVAAQAILVILAFLYDKVFGTHLYMILASPPTGHLTLAALQTDAVRYLFLALQAALMFTLLRLSPITSYHAAEHQVVHAIEAGEPLEPEIVAQMPRAHPRCGTNLWAGAMLFLLICSGLGTDTGLIVALVVVVAGWRSVGYYLQQYITTKRASPRHIQNGIKAGEELLAKYQREPNKQADGWSRIWNMGLVQVALGFTTVLQLSHWLLPKLGLSSWF
jgi:hypothetical protein